MMGEENKNLSRKVSKATHLGDLQETAATGTKVQVNGIWIDRIAHGRIAERWGVLDVLGLMEQLGVMTN